MPNLLDFHICSVPDCLKITIYNNMNNEISVINDFYLMSFHTYFDMNSIYFRLSFNGSKFKCHISGPLLIMVGLGILVTHI